MTISLKNKTIFITGSSRGVGAEIALRCAEEGANIVVTGKTAEAHPTLSGTIYSVAKEIEKRGGQALPIMLDVRDDTAIAQAVATTVEKFGGIDALVNNASALNVTPTLNTPMKRFDLMFGVNVRGTFACSQACIPFLKKSTNPHIINISPPLNMNPKWFKDFLVYTMSKYGMSMCTLGMAEEFQSEGIAVNSLWPQTMLVTAAVEKNFPPEILKASRSPRIMADAAYYLLTTDSKKITGRFFTDEEVLKLNGVKDFACYVKDPNVKLFPDIFLE
jgi:citronellol/citronellal dehydrogenase